jgi:hypothetical protein
MKDEWPTVVWVRPATSPRRTAQVLRWLRRLAPAAMLIVTQPSGTPPDPDDSTFVLDAEEGSSGPLSIADALLRGRKG